MKRTFINAFLFLVVATGCTNPLVNNMKSNKNIPLGPAPTVSSVSPSAGALTGGTTLTISGFYFASGATVNIGSAACLSVTFVTTNQITCVTAPASAGAVTVTVINPDQQSGRLVAGFEFSASIAAGTSYAVLVGGGISTGGGYRIQGSAGDRGVPFYQSGTGVRVQSGIQGVLQAP